MSGSSRPRILSAAALAVVAVLVVAETSAAQGRGRGTAPGATEDRDVRLDARAGIAVPLADMRDYVDEGPVLGAGVAYRLSGRLSARVDWTAALMRPADRRPLRNKGVDIRVRGSETDLHHLTGALQAELSDPGRTDIEVRGHAGAGVTLLSTEETRLAEGGNFTQFTLDIGLELAVPLNNRFRFIGRGDLYILPFRAGGPEHLLREVTLPFSGGLSMSL